MTGRADTPRLDEVPQEIAAAWADVSVNTVKSWREKGVWPRGRALCNGSYVYRADLVHLATLGARFTDRVDDTPPTEVSTGLAATMRAFYAMTTVYPNLHRSDMGAQVMGDYVEITMRLTGMKM